MFVGATLGVLGARLGLTDAMFTLAGVGILDWSSTSKGWLKLNLGESGVKDSPNFLFLCSLM